MDRIAVVYATSEGHTQRVAEHAGRRMAERGFEPSLRNLKMEPNPDLNGYAALILASPVHSGKHRPEMVRFVKQHLDELSAVPAAFLSVTLSQAGVERKSATPAQHARFVAEVEKLLTAFFQETGWQASRIKAVAGALMYSKYNFFVRWMMKRAARESGASTDTSRDHVYTDWGALNRFLDEFAQEIPRSSAAPSSLAHRAPS